jgi:hypothetical protein
MPLVPTLNHTPYHFLQQEMHMNVGDGDDDNNNLVVDDDENGDYIVVDDDDNNNLHVGV